MTFPDVPLPNQWGNTGDPAESINRVKMQQRVDANLNLLQARVAANLLLTTAIEAYGSGGLTTPTAGSQLQVQFGSTGGTTSGGGVLTVALPATFPGGLSWWWGSPISPTGVVAARSTVTGSTASQINFTVYNTAGTINGVAATVMWMAVGF